MTVKPLRTFDSVEEARATLEPYLKDWEAEFDMKGLPIRFEFSGCHEEAVVPEGQPKQHHVMAQAQVGGK